MTWMISNGKPFVILFTKTDKLSKTEQKTLQSGYIKGVQSFIPRFMPEMITTSSTTRQGREEIIALVKEMKLI